MRYGQIISTGSYVPKRVVTNARLEQTPGESVNEWLIANVGIRERHYMADDEVISGLAANAVRAAMQWAGLRSDQLDLIIVATDTPDYLSPATASALQAKLGAPDAGTFDVNCACAGWVTGLDIAAKYLAADPAYRYILLVGAYGMSRFLDQTDQTTATLFADGAGAVVLGASSEPGWLATKLAAVGEYHDALGIYTGGTARPATAETVGRLGRPSVEYVRKFRKTFNSEHWLVLIRNVLARASLADPAGRALEPNDVDRCYFTQLNLRTIEQTMAAWGQPLHKTHWIMDKWACMDSACIPMALVMPAPTAGTRGGANG